MRRLPVFIALIAAAAWPASAQAAGTPTITSLKPTSGPAGTQVLITGTHLLHTTGVQFAGRPAAFTVLTSSKVDATVPAAAISGTVTLATTSGSTESRTRFDVTTGIVTSPRYAGPGATVAVSGSGFPPSADVTLEFDGSQVAQGRTNAAGGFQALDFRVPDAPFGPHDLVAVSGAFSSAITFLLESDWAFGRHDVAGSGNDGNENTLTTANVGSMVKHWSFTTAAQPAPTPVEANGIVYIGDAGGDVYAIHANTGKQLWKVQPDTDVGGAAAVDGTSVFVGDGDSLYALSTATGKTRWSVPTMGSVLDAPAVSSNTVYFTSWNGTMTALYSVNETNGAINWTRPLSTAGLGGSPALSSAEVYVTDYSGTAYAVDRSTGKVTWKHAVGGTPAGTPDVANGEVYVIATASSTHDVWDLNGATGARIWAGNWFPTYSSPSYDAHTIFLGAGGANNGGVLALNASTGAQDWLAQISSDGDVSPAIANGVVYDDVATNLQAFDEATGQVLFTSAETIGGGSPIVDSGQVIVAYPGAHTIYAYGL